MARSLTSPDQLLRAARTVWGVLGKLPPRLRFGLIAVVVLVGLGVLIAAVVVELSVAAAGGISVVAAVVVLAQVSAAVLLANALGLWFSVTCQTATRASAYSLLALLTLTVAPLLGGFAAFSPPAGVWLAHERPVSAVVPVALQLLAIAGLGWHAVRRFERYGR